MKDVRGLTRETIPPASHLSLPQNLLFIQESMGNLQETTFVRTEEGRSGTLEITVWAPQLEQLKASDRTLELCRVFWTSQTGQAFT